MNNLGNNRLERLSEEAQGFWKHASSKPMTIAIGLIGDNTILLASDSQTSNDNTKWTGTKKIRAIDFGAERVLIAEAGNADRSGRAVELLIESAREQKLTDYRTAADAARKAMLQVREELRVQRFNCSPESLDDYIWKHDQQCWLLVAHYFEGSPFIFSVDLASGAANKRCDKSSYSSHYAVIGTGSALASYLLDEYSKPKLPPSAALAAALYVIEEVKKHDTYCSGETKFGWLEGDNKPITFPQELVNEMSQELAKFNKVVQDEWNKKLTGVVDAIGTRFVAKLKKDDPKPPDKPN